MIYDDFRSDVAVCLGVLLECFSDGFKLNLGWCWDDAALLVE